MPARALTGEALTPLLRERLSPGAVCLGVVRGAAGNGQETWFLEVEDGGARRRLVLRRSADGSLGWTDRAHEYEVLRALRPHGLPVPGVLWLETEPSSLGRPYFVMERMPGGPLGRAEPAVSEAVARADRRGACAAACGSRPGSWGSRSTPPADGAAAAAAELGRWRDRYLAERLDPVPLLGALIAWLDANLPPGDAPVALLWGDPGPHNVLIAEGELTALLDWELSHLGHPLDDLGACLWAARGQIDGEHVVEAYERATGAKVDRAELRWFECLACVSRSVMVIEGTRAFVEGRATRAGAGRARPRAARREPGAGGALGRLAGARRAAGGGARPARGRVPARRGRGRHRARALPHGGGAARRRRSGAAARAEGIRGPARDARAARRAGSRQCATGAEPPSSGCAATSSGPAWSGPGSSRRRSRSSGARSWPRCAIRCERICWRISR